jgi:hypothetical protein
LPRFGGQFLGKRINQCTGFEELGLFGQEWEAMYDQTVYIFALVLIPLLLIYILNTVLIVTLRTAMSKRAKMTEGKKGNGRDHSQNQGTVMVISVALVFTICETPASIDRLAMLFGGFQFADDSAFENYVRKIGLFLVVVDSAMNFLAYCISNRTFRQNLVALFGTKKSNSSQ